MEFATYYFTLLVMLASVLAAATCFSAYLVSRSRAMILAFGGFLCYFIDVAFMLQDSIAAVVLGTSAGADASYLLMRSVGHHSHRRRLSDLLLAARLRLRGRAAPQPYGGGPPSRSSF